MSKMITLGYINGINEKRHIVVQTHNGLPHITAALLGVNNAWWGDYRKFTEWVENALGKGNTYGYYNISDDQPDDYGDDADYYNGYGFILSEFGVVVSVDGEQYAFFDYDGKGELV